MSKLTLPKLSVPKISTKVLGIAATVLVFVGILGIGIVTNVRQERAEAAANSQAAAQEAAEDAATAKEIADLKTQVKQLESNATVATLGCAEFRRLDSIRAITGQVTVPAYCQGR